MKDQEIKQLIDENEKLCKERNKYKEALVYILLYAGHRPLCSKKEFAICNAGCEWAARAKEALKIDFVIK